VSIIIITQCLFYNREMVVVFGCDVGHSICVGCFVEYMENELSGRRFLEHPQLGYTIKCPGICYTRLRDLYLYLLQLDVMVQKLRRSTTLE